MSAAPSTPFTERWPELFEGLSDRQASATVRALAVTADGVDEPGYEDFKALTDVSRGRPGRTRVTGSGRGAAPAR